MRDLEESTEYTMIMEEKVFKSNTISLELLKQLKEAEVEIETLRQFITELKRNVSIYVPQKEDYIDVKLAEYINNFPDRNKLKIIFMREA